MPTGILLAYKTLVSGLLSAIQILLSSGRFRLDSYTLWVISRVDGEEYKTCRAVGGKVLPLGTVCTTASAKSRAGRREELLVGPARLMEARGGACF